MNFMTRTNSEKGSTVNAGRWAGAARLLALVSSCKLAGQRDSRPRGLNAAAWTGPIVKLSFQICPTRSRREPGSTTKDLEISVTSPI